MANKSEADEKTQSKKKSIDVKNIVKEVHEKTGLAVKAGASAQTSVRLLEKLPVGTVLSFLRPIAEGIPIVRLVLNGVNGLLDITRASFWDEGHPLSRAAKVGLAIGAIAVTVVGFAVPPVGIAMLVASVSIALVKEVVGISEKAFEYYKLSKELKVKQVDLEKAKKANNPDNKLIENLQEEIEKIKDKQTLMKAEFVQRGLNTVLGAISIVGAAMLLTPLAPIGLGILVASSGIGAVANIGMTIVKNILNKRVTEKAKARVEARASREGTNTDKDVLADKEQMKEVDDSTATMSVLMANEQVMSEATGELKHATHMEEQEEKAEEEVMQEDESVERNESEESSQEAPTENSETVTEDKKEKADDEENADEEEDEEENFTEEMK